MSSTARRSLLTATTAATLLGALWFVPSANASGTAGDTAPQEERTTTAVDPAAEPVGEELLLADSGSVDTTPYLVGGTAFLLAGAGFVAYAARRGPWVAEDAGLT
ncbi:hypothetical protein KQH42_19800 [Streptomyces sp. CHA1]|uniref:hypothetical protein n=1 Tax=Streptomyces TaxID=1883 RepID=UPI00053E6B18|nr:MULTISPECIES: hypothetical protein [unclassified Streptomyces]QPA01141.1 hypothetical protein DI273_20965 [Streptomyces violascens]UYM23892.1 hypothetical protein NQP46_11315 [Streptomyces albus]MBT3156068.1 hypothetical protein [Streptomyces sp. G11C]MCO6702604.1 hypothetical protein [Streptomyces sp. CHB9.2]MCO6709008.1 hypothetical protein [Streptomyces sp. CHA3]